MSWCQHKPTDAVVLGLAAIPLMHRVGISPLSLLRTVTRKRL
jgi:hypothetical protein